MTKEELRQLLGANVRRLALEKGISINHLADFAGISRAMLSRTINSHHAMTTDRMAKICEALEVHPVELLKPLPPE